MLRIFLACDLSSVVWVHTVDKSVELFTDHLLLLLRVRLMEERQEVFGRLRNLTGVRLVGCSLATGVVDLGPSRRVTHRLVELHSTMSLHKQPHPLP